MRIFRNIHPDREHCTILVLLHISLFVDLFRSSNAHKLTRHHHSQMHLTLTADYVELPAIIGIPYGGCRFVLR